LKTHKIKNNGPLFTYTFTIFEKFQNIRCEVISRKGGFSEGAYASMNLSFMGGDCLENTIKNRERLAQYFQLKPDSLFFPEQRHTNNVKIVDEYTVVKDLNETDALITNKKEIGIGVLAADCVPIVFYDPIQQVVAVAHAGWRGTVNRIVEKVVVVMVQKYSSRQKDLLVGIGPCISQKIYEVGNDVIKKVVKLGDSYERFLVFTSGETKALLDLQGVNKKLLENIGVIGKNIELIPICTFETPEFFFSARRDGFASGRFGLVIALK
jgi:polyphenol oxidase